MKTKVSYTCTECGYKTLQNLAKCPSCGSWGSLEKEETAEISASSNSVKRVEYDYQSKIVKFADLDMPKYLRTSTGLGELDRVLGGGIVDGSAILISGEPGIGKSTLLMQISDSLCKDNTVLYVSGEESGGQLKIRASRLNITGDNLYILIETNIDRIIEKAKEINPTVIIIDSIQTMYDEHIASVPGSITQVKECANRFISIAKNEGVSIFLVSHVNKEGGIAGPKVLEHAVDAVLYFEGEKRNSYRIIRAIKNRFGSTNEIGVFEMNSNGLSEVPNPSETLLAGRPENASGSCALCLMEGSRPIIAEIQSLTSKTSFPSPKRTSNGVDYNRVYMILAVLEKRLGLKFYENDVYINVIGGLKVDEPSADAAIALSLISAIRDKVIPDDVIAIGEIGLAGECRAVSNAEQRIKEAIRLGFKKIILPYKNNNSETAKIKGAELVFCKNIYQMILPENGIF